MKIAIFLPNWIGDAVMATPALRAVRNLQPAAEIIGVMRPYVADVIAGTAASATQLRSYIFISTNMVYPGGPGGFDISPLRPLVPEEKADVADAAAAPEDYGGLKLKCEAALQEAWQGQGCFPFTTIRPPSVIGPGCDVRHELLQRVAMGLPVPETKTRPETLCEDPQP